MNNFYLILCIIGQTIALLTTIGKFFKTISSLETKLASLESRINIDEKHLEERTKELYNSRLNFAERISKLEASQS